jgi:phage regulator Rha-like protein
MTESIVPVSSQELAVTDLDGQLVVDSRLIAERLGLQHETVVKNIRKYAADFQSMGNLRFEIGTSHPNANGAQHQISFVCLNELQANFLMTLSKNTDRVVWCKRDLVIAFDRAKQIIKTVIPAQNDRIRELELEVELERERNKRIDTTSTLVALHGEALGLTIAGLNVGQIIETRVPTTEVLNPATGSTSEFLSADQLAKEVKRRTGQNIKNAEFIRKLKAANRDDLILPVTRNQTCEYVSPDWLDEAIEIVFSGSKQGLLKPVGAIARVR